MKTDLYNHVGEVVGNVDLPDKIFGVKINPDLIHQVLAAQMANARHPYAHTKDRGEVRGGGKKPWRQKGTGRARHGSRRSPIWIGGGVAFGPRKERNFSQKVNKKTKRKALFMVLSGKARDKELMVLDNFKFEEPKTTTETQNKTGNTGIKTKRALFILDKLGDKMTGYKKSKKKRDSILLVTLTSDKNVVRATNNLPFASVLSADSLNVKDLLEKKYLILLKDAVSVIEKTYRL